MASKSFAAVLDGQSLWPTMVGMGVVGFGLIAALRLLMG